MLPAKGWTTYDPRLLYRHDYVWCVPEGPIPSVGWEQAREGIDDYRYLRRMQLERRTHGLRRRRRLR